MNNRTARAILAVGLLGASGLACAHDAGDWIVRFGASNVEPKSNNNPIAEVKNDTSLTFTAVKMLTDRWSLELLAAAPFKHDIALKGGPVVGSTKHLPPTLSLQYHLNPEGALQPYVGLGLNYTTFFNVKAKGPLAGSDLDVDDSWGAAAQIGVDYQINEKWLINFDLRWIEIETGAFLDGTGIGDVDINPTVYGFHVGYKF